MPTRIPDISHRAQGAARGRGHPLGGVDSPSVEWLLTFAQFRYLVTVRAGEVRVRYVGVISCRALFSRGYLRQLARQAKLCAPVRTES